MTRKHLILYFITIFFLNQSVGWAGDFKKGMDFYKTGNYRAALEQWAPLAQNGNPQAQYHFGKMYADGIGVPRNFKIALKWWTLAATQGVVLAQHNLGVLYFAGRGVRQNDETAVKWWRIAAEKGNPYAQNNLGVMHNEGKGVSKDYQAAFNWYTLAAKNGLSDARKNLSSLRLELINLAIDRCVLSGVLELKSPKAVEENNQTQCRHKIENQSISQLLENWK